MAADLGTVVAVAAGLAAAASFGAAGLLQHQAARRAPEAKPLHPSLLVSLIRFGDFRWGVVLGALGWIFQIIALRYGPLALVQPLLVTGLLFYLGFAAVFLHHPPDRLMVFGALLALVGLCAFLVAADPAAGAGQFDSSAALPLGLALVAVVAVCLAVASRMRGEGRVVPVAIATAVCYGVTAGLVRSLAEAFGHENLLTHWELYAIIVVGPAGFLLNQNAFQAGMLGSVAVAITTVGDPVVAIGVGAAWLGESLASGPWRTTTQVLSLMIMAAGIMLLAERAQRVADRLRAAGERGGGASADAGGGTGSAADGGTGPAAGPGPLRPDDTTGTP